MSATAKISGSERERLQSRMAEYMDNYRESKKPRFQGRRGNYDFGAKTRARLDRVGHRRCIVFGSQYRENYDSIFRRNAK